MADITTLPDLEFIKLTDSSGNDILTSEASNIGSTSLKLASEPSVGQITKAIFLGFTVGGKRLVVYIGAGGFSDSQTATITTRPVQVEGLDITTAASSDLDIDIPSGTKVYCVIPPQHAQMLFSAGLGAISSSIKHASRETFDNGVPAGTPIYADAATGEAAISSPLNGDSFYATTEGVVREYIGGAWGNSTGVATPNASTTVAGKVEEATTAEMGAGTATGGTGARLFVNSGNLVKTSSGAGDENKVPVLDSTGKLAIGFIPGEELTLTAGENLTAEDLSYVESDGKAYKSLRSITSSAQLGSIAGTPRSLNTLKLSDDTVIAIYGTGSAAKGVVSTISRTTPTPGTEATIVSSNVRASKVKAAVIDTNKVAITYENTSDNKLYGVVITISGTTISSGTPVKLYDTETVNAETMDICKLDTDKFLVSFTNLTSDDAMAVAATVAGTVITPGTALQVEATTAVGETLCEQITTDVACMIYDDGTNLSYVVLEVSGTTVTANTALDLYAGSIVLNAEIAGLIVLDTQNVLFYNLNGGALRVSRIFNVNDSDWSSTPSHEPNHDAYLQLGSTTDAQLFKFDNEKLGLIHKDASDAFRFKQYKLANNAFEELFSATISGVASADSVAGVAHVSNKNRAFFHIADGTDLEYAFFIDTSDQFIGVVKTTVSATESATLITDKNAPISGLTAGKDYWVGDAGAVATSGQRRIGVATTTTNLRLI
jgi:hypothetical protein